ncbi:HVA22-like protein a [Vitis vinifera]|uniref:HVA22-like protein a n=1 Tax=Vitis vinifera TaxID=29760 RepID=A0A438G4Y2_VITVI|nr:HVA22-like protein a [Vitis vinifera]
MGFMNVLKFSAACFDILAWPLFHWVILWKGLFFIIVIIINIISVLHRCSSIRAIETNSISDFRKLVAYWVLFSLISLFDHAFSKLLEWVPFWPYIKLMVICWLVIPQFDGSYYVYQHLVHPCLSMDPQVVMNWLFNESKKKFHSRETFLVSADQYIKENGPEALEKLLARKLRSTKPNVEVKEIKAPAAPEKKGEQVSTLMWLFIGSVKSLMLLKRDPSSQSNRDKKWGGWSKEVEWSNAAKEEVKVTEVTQRTFGGTAQWFCIHVSWLTKKIQPPSMRSASAERAAALVAAEIEACRDDRTPKIPLHEKVQKEWACAVCQFTTQTEATFNSHLQGKRHQAISEQLRAKNQATKTNCSPSASMAKKSDQSTKEEQPKCTSNNLNSKNNGISAASTVKKLDETKDDEQQKSASSNGPNQKNNKKQEVQTNEQGHQKNLRQTGDGMKELRSWCNICNVSCTRELDMASHLNGRRHFDRIKQLSELWCSNCNCELQQQGGHGFSPKWEESLGSDQGPVKIMVWGM